MDLEQRAERELELKNAGLSLFLREDCFYGMNVLEGEVELAFAGEINDHLKLPSRILLGQSVDLPLRADQYTHVYPNNVTMLQALFIEGLTRLFVGGGVVIQSILTGGNLHDFHRALLNEVSERAPLTLFYVEGGIQKEGKGMDFSPSEGEIFPVNTVLKEYKQQFFSGTPAKPVVMVCSYNTIGHATSAITAIQDSHAILQNPGFHLVYRRGVCGILSGRGSIIYDR